MSMSDINWPSWALNTVLLPSRNIREDGPDTLGLTRCTCEDSKPTSSKDTVKWKPSQVGWRPSLLGTRTLVARCLLRLTLPVSHNNGSGRHLRPLELFPTTGSKRKRRASTLDPMVHHYGLTAWVGKINTTTGIGRIVINCNLRREGTKANRLRPQVLDSCATAIRSSTKQNMADASSSI